MCRVWNIVFVSHLTCERLVFDDKHPTENIDIVPSRVKIYCSRRCDTWFRHPEPLGAHPIGHGLDRFKVLRQIKQASFNICIP